MAKHRKKQSPFNLYNLAIIIAIILIAGSLYIILKPEFLENEEEKKVTPAGIEIIDTEVIGNQEITEEKAREIATKQFKSLGETNVKDEDLQVKRIRRDTEEFFYVSSMQNTVEIKIKGGEITRINSAAVEE